MITATEHPYIIRNADILNGEPIVKGTRTPVRAIAETWQMGITPGQISVRMPHLTMAQIFDALSYFSDHAQEITDYIQRNQIPSEKLHPSVKNL